MRNILILLFVSSLMGCSLFQRRTITEKVEVQPAKKPVAVTKRLTTESLEEQSKLGEATGSLWVSKGQSSYLFANNNLRLIGDLVNVKIEGYPKEQIQTKANVISKLLSEILSDEKESLNKMRMELDKQAPVQTRGPASLEANEDPTEDMSDEEKLAYQEKIRNIELQKKTTAKRLTRIGDEEAEIKKLSSGQNFPIEVMPARITEIYKNGNYQVSGTKPFMIGRREYKLLVSGMIKPEDFEESGVSAETLLDPTFDIISKKPSEEVVK